MRAYQWTIISFVIFGALIFFIPPSQVWLIFSLNIVFSFIQNLTTPLQWTMFSDVVDYEEHRSGRRWTGWSFQPPCLPSSLGWRWVGRWSVGCLAWWITLGSGKPGASRSCNHQCPVHLIPCVLFLCMVALLAIYKLNSRLVDSIARELASKRDSRNDAGQLSPATQSALQE